MRYIDTHTHLYDEAFKEDVSETVGRAIEAGVTKMVLPDIAQESRDAMFNLADQFPGNLFPCLGLHPTDVKENWEQEWEMMMGYKDRKYWAIGETGLDLYWCKDFFEQQKEAFRRQIDLSIVKDLPVIVHSREATLPILQILQEYRSKDVRGVLHAFSGSLETFHESQKHGDWYVGIGGVVTFKKASIAQTVKDIPLDRIILETDSPYLTPSPHRGTRNESSYIPLICSKIAEVKNISIEEVAEVTTRNAEKLFGI
jgi:TatD DNase family protein